MSYRSLVHYRQLRARFVPASRALSTVKNDRLTEEVFAKMARALSAYTLGR